MGDESGEENRVVSETEKKLEDDINKEISKLNYFLEETDELIRNKDYDEMGNLHKRADKIIDKLADIIAQAQELKLDSGVTPRAVRQWKKDVRSRYLSLVHNKNKLSREIQDKQRDLEHEREQQQADLEERRQQQQERRMAELCEWRNFARDGKNTKGDYGKRREDGGRATNDATKNGNGEISEGNNNEDAKIENYPIQGDTD